MDQAQADRIAAALNQAQRNTILGLTTEPQPLGCWEQVAYRMTKPCARRPALVERTQQPNSWSRYSLSMWGVQVHKSLMYGVLSA